MPNIYSSYPEVVLRVLEMAGFQCGVDYKRILTECPTQQFCYIEQAGRGYGELCVHHINELTGAATTTMTTPTGSIAAPIGLVIATIVVAIIAGIILWQVVKIKLTARRRSRSRR